MPEIDYGVDAPKLVRKFTWRAVWFIAAAVVIYLPNRDDRVSALPLCGVLFGIGLVFALMAADMVASSRIFKPKICNRIITSIPWRGDEQVLDVGCGRGLFLISAAKRLKTGKATGVDIWQSEDLSGNNAEAAMSNAKAEHVAGRVKIETADARKLPFPPATFDVVVSSLALHNIRSSQDRTTALHEIARVLKPGGYLAIFDIFHTGEYATTLKDLAFTDVHLSSLTFPWCVPARTLTARKAS